MNRKTQTRTLGTLFGVMLAAVLALAVLPGSAYAADGPSITLQPKDTAVNYPDGASFHVEVADPGSVKSWQWIASDGGSEFTLDGVSAHTDTLVIPATTQDDPDMFYCCVITDKDGKTVTSDPARLSVQNREEDKTVLYVGDHAVEPGEKLDLSKTTLGSGTVEFAADGVNITFRDIRISNAVTTYDGTLSPSMGLFLERRNSTAQEYYFHFLGDCQITDTYYDPAYNSAGVVVNAFFACKDDANAPTIIIDGDGKLTLRGGSNQIYTDANIELAADLTTDVYGSYFNDGITCRNLLIDEKVHVKLNVNGTAVHTDGDFRLFDGAVLDISSSSPHVSVGPTTKSMCFIVGSMYAKGAQINIKGRAEVKNFVPYHAFVATMSGILLAGEGGVNADNTAISIELTAEHSDEDYTMNFCGISGAGEQNWVNLSNGSKLDISIQTPEVNGVVGVAVGGIFEAEKDCKVNIDLLGSGEVIALEADRAFKLTDAAVETKVESKTGDAAFGIVCGEAEITMNQAGVRLHSTAKNGVALAADTGTHEDVDVKYVPNYKSEKIKLHGAECLTPAPSEINLFGLPGYGTTIKAETFFGSDTSKPAAEIILAKANGSRFADVADKDWFSEAVAWAVKQNVTTGTDDTHFSPDLPCTRAQMVTFLWRAAGKPVVNEALPFTDVAQDAYYADAVRWAVANKIVLGTTATTFSPNSPVSREQLATFLYRYAQSKGEGFVGAWYFPLTFDDAASVSSWADEGVHWCTMKGILSGVGNGRLAPQATATRAQIVTMLYRCFVPAETN